MFESEVRAVEAAYGAAGGACADLDMSALDRDQLVELLRRREVLRRQLEAADHVLLAEVVQRGIPAELGHPRPATFLRALLRITPAAAATRVVAAEHLGPRRGLTGEQLPPLRPIAARAVSAGEMSDRHAAVVVGLIDRLPANVERFAADEVEARLVADSRHLDPQQLAQAARRIEAHLNPDGILATEAEQERRRCLHVRPRSDGSASLTGELTGECAAVLLPVLQSLAAPRPSDVDGPDDRSPSQRNHDALLDAAMLLLSGDKLPHSGGLPATVLFRLTDEHLRGNEGLVETGTGQQLSVEVALRLADQALLVPVIFDRTGTIIGGGQQSRCASRYQRRLLAARDQGCSFPGCDRPPQWTQAHHVIEWHRHGETILDNLTLLCGHHHRTFGKRGWQCEMRSGLPWWIPPPWLDPDQNALRNHYFETLSTPN